MRGFPLTIARHGASVKQWKISFPLTALLFLFLFAQETQAMPKTPRQNKTTKSVTANSLTIYVKRNEGDIVAPSESTFKYYPYQAGLYLESLAAPDTIDWYYLYSEQPTARIKSHFEILPDIQGNIINLENFIAPNQLDPLPKRRGYHYFFFKRKGGTNKMQATIVEIRVATQILSNIIPGNPPPLPEHPLPSPQSPTSSTLEYPSFSVDNPPSPPEQDNIHGYLRHYDIVLHPIENATQACYQILNYDPLNMLVTPAPATGISPQGIFFNPLRTRFFFYTPGIKKISVSYGGHTQQHTINVPAPPRTPTVVLFNANDNNGNHKPDYQDGLFPEAPSIEDPELTPINLLGDSWMYYFPPWELGNDEFFSNYQGHRFRLSATDGIKLWNNQTRHFDPLLEWTINYQERDLIRQWLKTAIYIEGIQPSAQDGQELVKLELLDAQGEPVSFMTWPVSVLHLYVNHDSVGTDFENLYSASLFNSVKNPAVIVSNNNLENPEENCARFEVESSNPELLEKYEHLIEWHVSSSNGQHRPLLLDAQQIGDGFFSYGRKAGILGINPTTASIGLRLKGTSEDYISFRKPVVQRIRIPFVLQFFSEQPTQAYQDQITFLRTAIEDSLTVMNIIGRQAGIVFELKDATPENLISCYTNELFMEVKETGHLLGMAETFTLKETVTITPPMPPAKINMPTPGLDMFFTGYEKLQTQQGLEERLLGTCVIHRVEGDKAYIKPETFFLTTRPVGYQEEFILRPNLPQSRNDYETEIFGGTFLHKNIPRWALSEGTAAYCTALASMADVVNVNFVKSINGSIPTQLSAAIAPFDAPVVIDLHSEEKSATITTHFQYNSIPKLGDKNIAATLCSHDEWVAREFPRKLVFQSHHLVRAILETLGLKPMGLTGDMGFYNNAAKRNQALQENILVQRKNLLFINPISPCTDHTALPANYQPLNIMRGKNFPVGGRKHYGESLKINTVQAALLHIHPLPQPH